MGKKRENNQTKTRSSKTLPSSPTHSLSSSSSSDFEFTISLSPRTNFFSTTVTAAADELFYKGKLLPLHLSPRLSMVRILSSSDTSRASTSSASATSSSRPSSATDDDDLLRRALTTSHIHSNSSSTTRKKYFSFARISSVFKNKNKENDAVSGPVKRVGSSAREVIRKYLKKVKPFYDKVSKSSLYGKKSPADVVSDKSTRGVTCVGSGYFNQSFSGNLRFPVGNRRGGHVASCPSSMRSSPSHSGLPCRNIVNTGGYSNTTSSMEELHSAIQGAIAHCKNSLLQKQQPDPVT